MKYRTIVADPPWEYEGFAHDIGGEKESHDRPLPYEGMALGNIAALPVDKWADSHCRLFLWTTNRWLPLAFPLLTIWGFTYRQALVWKKRKHNIGGSVAPNSAEFLLVATRGRPSRDGFFPGAVLEAGSGEHSRKPDAFMDHIERISPAPRLELFARRQRLGWDTWGNEALNHVELESA